MMRTTLLIVMIIRLITVATEIARFCGQNAASDVTAVSFVVVHTIAANLLSRFAAGTGYHKASEVATYLKQKRV